MAWLLFITAKIKVLNSLRTREDITEIAFLLFTVVHRVVLLLPAEVVCEFIDKQQLKSKQAVSKAVRTHLQHILKMPAQSEEVQIVEGQVDVLLGKVSLKFAPA